MFFSNYLNLHQVHLMDEFYALLGVDFRFVATLPRNSEELKGGKDYSSRPYCILAGESDLGRQEAMLLARKAEVCVFGACSQEFALERAKQNRYGLSFEMGERWLKKGWMNVLSPVLICWWINYRRYYHSRPFYKLCCSAFTAYDDRRLLAYKGRHYKWGYFTEVQKNGIDSFSKTHNSQLVKIMWCARFLDLKHPELVVQLARRLKDSDYRIGIDMYGEGVELEKTKKLCNSLNVSDIISFKGNVPNTEIIRAMHQHDIFLFTSDKNEGWGVVLNEAMSSRCAVVASDIIGSAPFLIKDGYNGLLFKSGQIDSLYEKVTYLLDHPSRRQQMAEQGCRDMLRLWNPKNAAKSLLQLINNLEEGRKTSIVEGPCSIA